ncbi:beta-ketoacyl synthase N-terminal-like domain-containing protein [Streptomyces fumanus]|uniref:3-oxoacyl-ACP synthase n=1 Tax=Streptomyces fumanus TaxID=67302 RepID=A0A919AJI0_9ACTN|nr:beta-ketoacyl synthase N-terminal-like domain-containing protein [Streptomyces fumanus]GHF10439.1 3-oxoacyl-ACP synthase [Streptomyces fumanus]
MTTTIEATGPLGPGAADTGRPALVLSGWSAVTGYGVGREALREGVLSGRPAAERDGRPAVTVPEFRAADHLGRKGTRTMSRSTAFAVTAIDLLLRELGPEVVEDPAAIGLVLGVGQGNVQAAVDFTQGALTASRPYHVDALRFPDTFLNRAAGQSAIWHRLKGPNTTVAGGRLAGLLALGYAARLFRGGHCRKLLVGATEEYSPARAMLVEAAGGPDGTAAALGEGCVVALLEPAADAARAGRVPVATVEATHVRAAGEPGTAGAELAACVRAALAKAGATADRIRLVAPLGEDAEQEDAALDEVTGAHAPHRLRCRPLLGDAFAASAALQMSAALAAERYWPERGDLALVTGIDRDGTVGCALLGRPA